LWKLVEPRKQVVLGAALKLEQFAANLLPVLSPGTEKSSPQQPTTSTSRFHESLAFLPNVPAVAIRLNDGEVRIYHAGSGYLRGVCWKDGEIVHFVPRTDLFTAASAEVIERLGREACDATGSSQAHAILPEVPILFAKYSPDGRQVAVMEQIRGTGRLALRLVDVQTGKISASYPRGNVKGSGLAQFSPDGEVLAVVGAEREVRAWYFRASLAPLTIAGHEKEVWGLAFSPDGKTLASSGDDHLIKLWDTADGREVATLDAHASLATSVTFSPDGRLLASSSFDGTIRLWDTALRKTVSVLRDHTDRVRTVVFSPDGTMLASGGNDGTVRLWNVKTPREPATVLGEYLKWVSHVVFSPDGKLLYGDGPDNTIYVWDVDTRRLRTIWNADENTDAMALAPDGRTLAVNVGRGNIGLWDVALGRQTQSLRGHSNSVLKLAFSPDGLTLASASEDQSVRLWDTATGQELMALKVYNQPVRSLAFSPDGSLLATGSHDGSIKVWRTFRKWQEISKN
jgi:WD40 repeat protein